MNNKLTSMAGN